MSESRVLLLDNDADRGNRVADLLSFMDLNPRLVTCASGSCPSIWKSCSSSAASTAPVKPPRYCVIAVPPSAVIHSTEISAGITSTAVRNCRTVRPRETRAMNIPTNGDQLIHHAQ